MSPFNTFNEYWTFIAIYQNINAEAQISNTVIKPSDLFSS